MREKMNFMKVLSIGIIQQDMESCLYLPLPPTYHPFSFSYFFFLIHCTEQINEFPVCLIPQIKCLNCLA